VASSRGDSARAGWIARAERDKRDLSKRRDVRYAVQLELACELETLQKAWNWDKPSGTIWLLTTSYRGRTCFRVLWGRYGSLAQAREARSRVPEFFTAPGNRPTIVSVR
jgi:septal ring-binding cell division protein DamX